MTFHQNIINVHENVIKCHGVTSKRQNVYLAGWMVDVLTFPDDVSSKHHQFTWKVIKRHEVTSKRHKNVIRLRFDVFWWRHVMVLLNTTCTFPKIFMFILKHTCFWWHTTCVSGSSTTRELGASDRPTRYQNDLFFLLIHCLLKLVYKGVNSWANFHR